MSNVIEFSIKAIDDFSATMGKASSSLSGLEKALAAVGVTAAAYAAVRMAQASLDNAEAMGVAAEKANMTTESYSKLAWAAKMSNVEAGSLSVGMKMLNRAMAEGEATPAGEALKGLGIASKTASGELRKSEDVLLDVADAFANAKDDANKTKVAIELFGRGGLEMVPMLNQGSAGIRQMTADAEKLGVVIGDDFKNSADQVNDNLDTMSALLDGSVNKAMAEIAPIIETLTGQFIGFATEGDSVAKAGQFIANSFRVVISAGTILFAVFDGIGKTLGGLFAAYMQVAQGNFSQAFQILKDTTVDLGTTIGETVAKVEMQWDGSAQSAEAAAAREATAARKKMGTLKQADKQREEDAKKAKKAEEDRQKSITDSIQSLEKEAATYGLTSAQVKMYELVQSRASQAEIERAANAANAIMLQEQQNAATERAKAIIESLQSPLDLHNQKLAEINALRSEMTDGQFDAALAAENQRWAEAQAAVEWYGVSVKSVSQSIGDAMAQAVVDGGSLMKSLESVVKNVAKTIIASLIQMGVQRMLMSLIFKTAAKTESVSQMSTALGQVYLNSFASAAAIPVVGWAMAPGIATANSALASAGAAASIAVGAGLGVAAGVAHGGLDYVPKESTYLLDKGERVLSPRQNTDLTEFIERDGGSGGMTIGSLTIHVLENATNVDAFANMDRIQLRNSLGQPVVDALNEMFRIGVRPDFATAGR